MRKRQSHRKEMTRLGVMIKKHLLDRGMEHREFARKLGMSPMYLSKIIYGYRPPGEYTEALAKELGIDPEVVRILAA